MINLVVGVFTSIVVAVSIILHIMSLFLKCYLIWRRYDAYTILSIVSELHPLSATCAYMYIHVSIFLEREIKSPHSK